MGHRAGRGVDADRLPQRSRRRVSFPLVLAGVLAFFLGVLGVVWATGAGDFAIWWLTNREPPTLALAAPSEARRGVVPVTVQLDPPDRARIVDANVDGQPLVPGQRIEVDTAALPDGPHSLTVTAEDTSWRKNRATARATIMSDNTPPRLAVESQPGQVEQGHTWVLQIRASEPATVNATLGDRKLEVQPGNGFGWAIVGFRPETPTAMLPLVVEGTDAAGNRGEQALSLQVTEGKFDLDRVDVPASMLPMLGPDVRAAEDQRLAAFYKEVTRPRLWEGRFALPVRGPVVTRFGEQRSYNNGPIVPHHNGTDFAVPSGQPVLAPARGKVVLVDTVPLRGNVVILDHGLGVFTTYGHLLSADVQVGQVVERSQPFAKVGSSGLSTGPHLHWELWVLGENVDPLEWTERELP